MPRIQILGAAVLAAVLATGAAYGVGRWQGYSAGVSAAEARADRERRETQQELFDLGERLSRQAAELEEVKRAREDIVRELEDAARAAPGAGHPGVGADGVRRLQRRWGSP